MQIEMKQLDAAKAGSWLALGRLETRSGNFAGADVSLQKALALAGEDLATAAVAQQFLGRAHLVGLAVQAADVRAAAMFGSGARVQDSAKVRREADQATMHFQEALALEVRLGREAQMADDDAVLGSVYLTMRDFARAREMIGNALTLNTKLERQRAMAENYRALASAEADPENSEGQLKKALALDESRGEKEAMAEDDQALAELAVRGHRTEEAEALYKKALELTPHLEQRSLLYHLHELYQGTQQAEKAAQIERQSDALDEERRIASPAGLGVLLYDPDLGMYAGPSMEVEEVQGLEKLIALEHAMGAGARVGLATTYTLLGMHYVWRADRDGLKPSDRAMLEAQAEAVFRQAQILNKQLKRNDALVEVDDDLVRILDERQEPIEPLLSETLALYVKLKNLKSGPALISSLGYQRMKRGELAQACAYWRKGAALFPKDKDFEKEQRDSDCKIP
jgi:tetratricopeptide (TPR) repeat protein